MDQMVPDMETLANRRFSHLEQQNMLAQLHPSRLQSAVRGASAGVGHRPRCCCLGRLPLIFSLYATCMQKLH